VTITEIFKEQFILKTQKCTWWKTGCCFNEQGKSKGLLWFCSCSMLIQARLFSSSICRRN